METCTPPITVTTRGGWRALQKAELASKPDLLELLAPAPKVKTLHGEARNLSAAPSISAPRPKKQRISTVEKLSTTKERSSEMSPNLTPDTVTLRHHKRRNASKHTPSSTPSRTLSPEPIYRGQERYRSSSSTTVVQSIQSRDLWTDADGRVDPTFISSEMVVRSLKHAYKSYFRNPLDPTDTAFQVESMPTVELEYPNSFATERFLLLVPKDKDHYNPITCMEESLYAIVQNYLTPQQQECLGKVASGTFAELTSENSLSATLAGTPPRTRHNYLRSIQRAIRYRDGPAFLEAIDCVNQLLKKFKYPNWDQHEDIISETPQPLMSAVRQWDTVPIQVQQRILEETYQRCVGPRVKELSHYQAFSSEVYGELNHPIIDDIVKHTGLGPKSLFVDLGSGVGNVLLQASLQSGCSSFGIEIMPGPAAIAAIQLEHFQARCRMWGVSAGSIELQQGDILKSERVAELLDQADVVLVNNKVFTPTLNEALRPLFLDLKEGAVVVSLKPFVQDGQRINSRNINDMSSIFTINTREYYSGSVSWGSGGGHYYVHTVDRQGYSNDKERFESASQRRRHAR